MAHSTIPAFIRSYSSVFLSSSYPLKSEPLFGATGSIVNSLELSWCNFKNVGDEYTRLEKISQITRILKNKSLRVCWKSRNGINCCNCEKCSRTIIGLYICGANVKSYGFNITMDWFNNLKNEIIKYTFPAINDWLEMKEYIKSNAELVNDDNVNWIIDFDFIKIHEYNSNRKNMTKRITNW